MRLMKRNRSTIYYVPYLSKDELIDDNGYRTGENSISYGDAVALECSVSPATGTAQIETFGNLESYDKVVITDVMDCPIDENTVLFVDKEPEYTEDGIPIYDYTVKRIAKSLNFISYAISKVTVS